MCDFEREISIGKILEEKYVKNGAWFSYTPYDGAYS